MNITKYESYQYYLLLNVYDLFENGLKLLYKDKYNGCFVGEIFFR